MKHLLTARDDDLSNTSQFLDPPDSFGIVTQSISRCGAISPANFSFLSNYDFKTVLFINEDNPIRKIAEYFKSRGTKYSRIGIY